MIKNSVEVQVKTEPVDGEDEITIKNEFEDEYCQKLEYEVRASPPKIMVQDPSRQFKTNHSEPSFNYGIPIVRNNSFKEEEEYPRQECTIQTIAPASATAANSDNSSRTTIASLRRIAPKPTEFFVTSSTLQVPSIIWHVAATDTSEGRADPNDLLMPPKSIVFGEPKTGIPTQPSAASQAVVGTNSAAASPSSHGVLEMRGTACPQIAQILPEKTESLEASLPALMDPLIVPDGHVKTELQECDPLLMTKADLASIDLANCEVTSGGRHRHQCPVCQKTYASRGQLQQHLRLHTTEQPFQCDLCQVTLSSKSALTVHRRTHTGEKPFHCDTCEKTFASRAALYIHKRIHTAEKPFSCRYCGRTFPWRSPLIKHERTHTGEKPYQCELCQRSFTLKDTLNKHVRLHTNEKPYACDQCGKAYTQKSPLTMHLRKHTGEKPFQCGTCGKRFTSKQTKTQHEATHRSSVAFSCMFCAGTFTDETALAAHVQKHLVRGCMPNVAADKPFLCAVCMKTFSDSGEWATHVQGHVTSSESVKKGAGDGAKAGEVQHYICALCMQTFPDQAKLSHHVQTHLKESEKLVQLAKKPLGVEKCY